MTNIVSVHSITFADGERSTLSLAYKAQVLYLRQTSGDPTNQIELVEAHSQDNEQYPTSRSFLFVKERSTFEEIMQQLVPVDRFYITTTEDLGDGPQPVDNWYSVFEYLG